MWPGLPQLKQRPLWGSLFTGLVQSRSMGCRPEGTGGAEGLEEVEDVVTAKGVTEGGQNKDNLAEVAFGWVSRNCLHWLSSKEVLCFHSAQVDGIGSRR